MVNHDEKITVANAMIKYGGSFVSNLGKALMSADHINTKKIRITFSEYWDQYLEMGEKDAK